jgi:hypothetical protein
MKTKLYKVIILYYGSDAEDVMLFEDKSKAFNEYIYANLDSCIRCAHLFNPSGKLIYDV